MYKNQFPSVRLLVCSYIIEVRVDGGGEKDDKIEFLDELIKIG